jgi:hypothetical protein
MKWEKYGTIKNVDMWVQLYEISNLLKTWETFEVYVSGDPWRDSVAETGNTPSFSALLKLCSENLLPRHWFF